MLCQAKTKEGKPCPNRAKENDACGIKAHQRQMELKEKYATEPVLVMTRSELAALEAMPTMLTDLDRVLERGPKQDREGFLYVFRLSRDEHRRYYKVGMTTQTVRERLDQWQALNDKPVKLVASFPVPYARMGERLAHLLLYDVRLRRYIVRKKPHKRYITEWMYKEGDKRLTPLLDEDPANYRRYKKEVEWFYTPFARISHVITRVKTYLDQIKNG